MLFGDAKLDDGTHLLSYFTSEDNVKRTDKEAGNVWSQRQKTTVKVERFDDGENPE